MQPKSLPHFESELPIQLARTLSPATVAVNNLVRFSLSNVLAAARSVQSTGHTTPNWIETVAIKIPAAGALVGEARQRFLREAQSAARLRHPHIVQVHEVHVDGDECFMMLVNEFRCSPPIDHARWFGQHAGMSKRQPPEHDSDYDGAWKEALRKYFREFIQRYFPAVYAQIDWTAELEWYDKELSQVLGQPGSRNRSVDVLVKVRLLSGDEQWILVHLEIQTSFESDFAERIGLYNAGLYWTFRQRVATLVILADLNRNWLPRKDEFRLADFHSRLEFPICKLIEHLETDWRDDHSLPVLLARAQVEALRTASDPEGRFRAKWQLVRGLYELGYNAEQVRELFRLIDWMIHLRDDLSERFRIDLDQLEEELGMSYVTSVERLAKAEGKVEGKTEGKVEGKVEGKQEALSSLLEAKFGRLTPDVVRRIRQTDSVEKLSALLLQVLTVDSVEQLDW